MDSPPPCPPASACRRPSCWPPVAGRLDPGPRSARLARAALRRARQARRAEELREVSRAREEGHRQALPRLPPADRRAHGREEGSPPRRQRRLRDLPRRARRCRRRAAPAGPERLRPCGGDRVPPRRPPRHDLPRLRQVPYDPFLPDRPARVRARATRTSTRGAGQRLRPLPQHRRRVRRGGEFVRPQRAPVPAHRSALAVPCAKCHVDKAYKGLKFGACSDCHTDPHKQRFGADCASCHTTAAWRTNPVDHSRTRYPLEGRHRAGALRLVPPATGDAGPPRRRPLCELSPGRPSRGVHGRLRLLPHRQRLQGSAVRPCREDEVRAHRQARCDRVRVVPQAGARRGGNGTYRGLRRRVPRAAQRVHVVPHRRPQGRAGLVVRELSLDRHLRGDHVRPPALARVLRRRPRRRRLRALPHRTGRRCGRWRDGSGAQVPRGVVRLRLVPQGRSPRPARRRLCAVATRSRRRASPPPGSRTPRRASRSPASTPPSPVRAATRARPRCTRTGPALRCTTAGSRTSARRATRTSTSASSATAASRVTAPPPSP